MIDYDIWLRSQQFESNSVVIQYSGFTEIPSTPLLLSDWRSSLQFDQLKRLNVGMIVCLNDKMKGRDIIIAYSELNILHHHFELYDHITEAIGGYLEPIYQALLDFEAREPGRRILIHCTAGISRSPTVVLYYLIRKLNLSVAEAHQMLIQVRPIIKINTRFMIDLIKEVTSRQ
jgi:predicted protein tyrosine phosphatase